MRKYAVLSNNEIIEVVDLTEDQCQERSISEMVIDIEDQIPQPEVGWVLDGNTLKPSEVSEDLDARDAIQQKGQRLFGLKLLPQAVDLIGARNLKLSREGTPADVAALAGQMATIKLLLEGGALKTTRTICAALKPGFPHHSDILQYVIDEITNFLVSNGWN